MRSLLLLLVVCVAVQAEPRTFNDYSVFRTYANTDEQKQLLASMAAEDKYDFWSDINHVGDPVDIMVKPQDQTNFLFMLRSAGMNPEVWIEDVQSRINDEKVAPQGRAMDWNQYHTLDSINGWLDEVVAANPGKASIIIGGKSYQNRDIKGVKIVFKPGKKAVFVEGGIHAREWISAATVTYLINALLTNNDPAFRKVAESFEWHLFPSTNPDGYVWTHTSDRMWRKTRKPYGSCVGADPNRNWASHWGEQGASNQPCSDLYAGSAAFSEIETSTLSSYIRSIAANMVAYIDFHNYSQYFMLPYGHTTSPLDNYSQMMQIGRKSVEALARRYSTQYKVGNIAEIIYLASGGSVDWVKQEFKTPIVVAYELRDQGRYGFILPANQIIPNCLEVMDSIVGMMEEAEKVGYVTLG